MTCLGQTAREVRRQSAHAACWRNGHQVGLPPAPMRRGVTGSSLFSTGAEKRLRRWDSPPS